MAEQPCSACTPEVPAASGEAVCSPRRTDAIDQLIKSTWEESTAVIDRLVIGSTARECVSCVCGDSHIAAGLGTGTDGWTSGSTAGTRRGARSRRSASSSSTSNSKRLPHPCSQCLGEPMIACDRCHRWYHLICIDMSDVGIPYEDWLCKKCIKADEKRQAELKLGAGAAAASMAVQARRQSPNGKNEKLERTRSATKKQRTAHMDAESDSGYGAGDNDDDADVAHPLRHRRGNGGQSSGALNCAAAASGSPKRSSIIGPAAGDDDAVAAGDCDSAARHAERVYRSHVYRLESLLLHHELPLPHPSTLHMRASRLRPAMPMLAALAGIHVSGDWRPGNDGNDVKSHSQRNQAGWSSSPAHAGTVEEDAAASFDVVVPWASLPAPMLLNIFSFLGIPDVARVSPTCQLFREVGQNPLLYSYIDLRLPYSATLKCSCRQKPPPAGEAAADSASASGASTAAADNKKPCPKCIGTGIHSIEVPMLACKTPIVMRHVDKCLAAAAARAAGATAAAPSSSSAGAAGDGPDAEPSSAVAVSSVALPTTEAWCYELEKETSSEGSSRWKAVGFDDNIFLDNPRRQFERKLANKGFYGGAADGSRGTNAAVSASDGSIALASIPSIAQVMIASGGSSNSSSSKVASEPAPVRCAHPMPQHVRCKQVPPMMVDRFAGDICFLDALMETPELVVVPSHLKEKIDVDPSRKTEAIRELLLTTSNQLARQSRLAGTVCTSVDSRGPRRVSLIAQCLSLSEVDVHRFIDAHDQAGVQALRRGVIALSALIGQDPAGAAWEVGLVTRSPGSGLEDGIDGHVLLQTAKQLHAALLSFAEPASAPSNSDAATASHHRAGNASAGGLQIDGEGDDDGASSSSSSRQPSAAAPSSTESRKNVKQRLHLITAALLDKLYLWEQSLYHCRQALQLDPYCASAWHQYCGLLAQVGAGSAGTAPTVREASAAASSSDGGAGAGHSSATAAVSSSSSASSHSDKSSRAHFDEDAGRAALDSASLCAEACDWCFTGDQSLVWEERGVITLRSALTLWPALEDGMLLVFIPATVRLMIGVQMTKSDPWPWVHASRFQLQQALACLQAAMALCEETEASLDDMFRGARDDTMSGAFQEAASGASNAAGSAAGAGAAAVDVDEQAPDGDAGADVDAAASAARNLLWTRRPRDVRKRIAEETAEVLTRLHTLVVDYDWRQAFGAMWHRARPAARRRA